MPRISLLLMAGHLWAAHLRNMRANLAHKGIVWTHLWSIIKFCWSYISAIEYKHAAS